MVEVPLTQGKVALIDDEDAERVLARKWTLMTIERKGKVLYYARRSVPNKDESRPAKTRTVLLHRFIINAPEGQMVDHINHDGLDNRRDNLRLATNSENHFNIGKISTNSSGYKGVFLRKKTKSYVVVLTANGYKVRLGGFNTAIEAARAYDELARTYHGEFARLNFPNESEQAAR